jgi:hypothetical protein
VNAVAVMYVNDHLEHLRSEAKDRRLASLADRRSLRDRIGSAVAEIRKTLGVEAAGPALPKLKNYPYGG